MHKQIYKHEISVSSEENNELDCDNASFSDFDHNKLIANLFLELREIYWTTIEASCFVKEKVMHLFQIENKIRYSMFRNSVCQSNPEIILDLESELFKNVKVLLLKHLKSFQ